MPAAAVQLRAALREYRGGGPAQRVRAAVTPKLTAMVLLPGLANGVPAYTVKVHAKTPALKPALSGVILLHDLQTGALLAALDSPWLTALRTGLGAALGTVALARASADRIGVIGAGIQGRAALRALAGLRALEHVAVYDREPDAAERFAAEMGTELRVSMAATSLSVASGQEIVLVATWSRTPVIDHRHINDGAHLTSLGADEPGKLELGERLWQRSLTVVDDSELAGHIHATHDATIAAVLRGEHPGRSSDQQVTVYSPVGLPMQDCVIAWHAYHRARELGKGVEVKFGQ